ncbi:AGAP012173-PA-like protein [Anopheles sinensis]|uniref:AGAP012173-PA-like protein n=1 Tax=Anopheles sinensis TaxID=74873 RepID=A0A084VCM7_ANOSI|nr:AGAP012173-PA-like protein [Anopheles sinensis]
MNKDDLKYIILCAARSYLVDHRRLVPIFRYLLEATEDLWTVDRKGRTLLHYFARVGYVYMVKYLIEQKGFSPQTVNDKNGWNAFHYCVSATNMPKGSEPNYCTIFRFMMEKERAVGIHAIGFDGNNVLQVAVENHHFSVGKLIVASVLENVTTSNAQQALKEYFEVSNLSIRRQFGDFLDFLIDDEQGDFKDVFRSVKEQLHI